MSLSFYFLCGCLIVVIVNLSLKFTLPIKISCTENRNSIQENDSQSFWINPAEISPEEYESLKSRSDEERKPLETELVKNVINQTDTALYKANDIKNEYTNTIFKMDYEQVDKILNCTVVLKIILNATQLQTTFFERNILPVTDLS